MKSMYTFITGHLTVFGDFIAQEDF